MGRNPSNVENASKYIQLLSFKFQLEYFNHYFFLQSFRLISELKLHKLSIHQKSQVFECKDCTKVILI